MKNPKRGMLKKFNNLYVDYLYEVESLKYKTHIKEHVSYKKVVEFASVNYKNKDKFISALIRDLVDIHYRCFETAYLLEGIVHTNPVPYQFRKKLDDVCMFWIQWYEDSVLKNERHFG